MRTNLTFGAALFLAGLSLPLSVAAAEERKCFDKGELDYAACAQQFDASRQQPISFTDGAEVEGAYFALRGGLAQTGDADFSLGAAGEADAEFDPGYVAGGALGYQFTDVEPGVDLRVELELGYQEASLDQFFVNGAAAGDEGEAGVAFGFANLYADFQVAPRVELFLGGGVGLGVVDLEQEGVGGLMSMADGETAFGYHLDAGLNYQLSKDVTLEASYRYSSFLDAEVSSGGFNDEVDLDSHQLLLGVRFKF